MSDAPPGPPLHLHPHLLPRARLMPPLKTIQSITNRDASIDEEDEDA
jgi:hypothetical protein